VIGQYRLTHAGSTHYIRFATKTGSLIDRYAYRVETAEDLDNIYLRKVGTSDWLIRTRNPHSGWCRTDDQCEAQELVPFIRCSEADTLDGSESTVHCSRRLCEFICNS
jgi:hypothetical protein